jgi:Fe-S cluster assembly protein SufD
MSGTQATTNNPRFMREEPKPALTPALEEAVTRFLDESPYALSEVRAAAAEALRRIGLPHTGSEDFSFIRLGEILPHLGPLTGAPNITLPSAEEVAALVLPESRESYAVLVDGFFIPGLSHPGPDFLVRTLEESAPVDSPLAGMHVRFQLLHDQFVASLVAAVREETDAAAALATLYAYQPVLIRVPEKKIPASPLQLIHFASGSGRADALVIVHAGPHSESRILVRHASLSGAGAEAGMENTHTLALIDAGASLKFLEAGEDESASPASRRIRFRKLTARLARDARLLAVSAHTGARILRNAFAIDLAGEGAEAEIHGATVLTGDRQSHNFVRVRHLVPHCISRQNFKSVAAEQSRSSVDGTIYVAPGAQQTNAYQLINNLMLSDEARADSKPRLMIFADDVKCSHGATSGKLDAAQQFYLESRGIPPAQARALLTVAFIAEVLEKSGKPDEGFRGLLDHALLDALKHRLPSAQGVSHG